MGTEILNKRKVIMTNEEAKKAGFRKASGALYVYWHIENGHIYVRSCDACALTGDDFPTRAKAREALRKRKAEAATERMNEADINMCIKRGYAWSSCGDKPETTPTRDYTREQLATYEGLHATKREAQKAIDASKMAAASKRFYVTGLAPDRPANDISTPVMEGEDHIQRMEKAGYVKAFTQRDAGWPRVSWITSWSDAEEATLMDGLDKKNFTAIEWGTELLRRKRKENEEVNRKSRFIDNFVQPMQEYLSSKSKSDAEHAKWLADMQAQTTPITLGQREMLRVGDRVWGIMFRNADVTQPEYIREQVLEDIHQVERATSFDHLYFTYAAAQAALDKAKAEAEPLEWCERKEGDTIDWSSDEITWDNKGKENWQHPTPFSGLQPKVGDLCDELGIIRARYRNPLWLAKHGTDTETKPTTTPAKPHESAKVEETKPTTVRGWLETIPDPAIRAAAIRQCEDWDKNCTNLPDSILKVWNWDLTSEGVEFWKRCYDAAYDGTPWPVYPSKAKQEADGWTQDEIDKAALKPDAVSHPSHYTSHPSGVECITITKHMNFCRGNAVKYLWRAGQKGDTLDKEIEDIAKAGEYCRIEKERLIAKKGAK